MTNQKLRITSLDTTVLEMVTALGGGNPGALRVCLDLLKYTPSIDPDAFDAIAPLLSLDMLGVYEHRIWMLYKDVCGEDLSVMLAAIRAVQLGIVASATLDHAIDHRGAGLDLGAAVAAVCERLPNFCLSAIALARLADAASTTTPSEAA